jgi:hypothetical protein
MTSLHVLSPRHARKINFRSQFLHGSSTLIYLHLELFFQKKAVFVCETRFIYRTPQSAALRESFKTLSPSFILADRAARKFNLLSFYFYHARSPADMLQVEAHSTPQLCSLLTVHHKRTFVFSGRITCLFCKQLLTRVRLYLQPGTGHYYGLHRSQQSHFCVQLETQLFTLLYGPRRV